MQGLRSASCGCCCLPGRGRSAGVTRAGAGDAGHGAEARPAPPAGDGERGESAVHAKAASLTFL